MIKKTILAAILATSSAVFASAVDQDSLMQIGAGTTLIAQRDILISANSSHVDFSRYVEAGESRLLTICRLNVEPANTDRIIKQGRVFTIKEVVEAETSLSSRQAYVRLDGSRSIRNLQCFNAVNRPETGFTHVPSIALVKEALADSFIVQLAIPQDLE